ncbi:MAG: hypothetical protein IPK26_18370 [Planctomycetes bacterium]|nr:hypothetical protein [Planctomycetota bacterium]
MSRPPLVQAELERRIVARLLGERVDPTYLRFVLQHLDDPDDTWRFCCASSCDPCVRRLARVVDAVRRELAEIERPPA